MTTRRAHAHSSRVSTLLEAAGRGGVAGVVGVAAMTVGEKLEQSVTHRADSYVPGRTLLTLLGRPPGDDARPAAWNHAMHWGTGACLGALRGVWAAVGLRGSQAHVAYCVVRLAFDQTMENGTGAGAPPHSWPRDERIADIAHKAVYALVTGLVADRWITPALESRSGVVSH